jgi:hypothetical protein
VVGISHLFVYFWLYGITVYWFCFYLSLASIYLLFIYFLLILWKSVSTQVYGLNDTIKLIDFSYATVWIGKIKSYYFGSNFVISPLFRICQIGIVVMFHIWCNLLCFKLIYIFIIRFEFSMKGYRFCTNFGFTSSIPNFFGLWAISVWFQI